MRARAQIRFPVGGARATSPRARPAVEAEIGIAARHVTFHRGFSKRLELGVGDVAAINVARVPLRRLVVIGVCEANVRRLRGWRGCARCELASSVSTTS
jgi:hypothetical protein